MVSSITYTTSTREIDLVEMANFHTERDRHKSCASKKCIVFHRPWQKQMKRASVSTKFYEHLGRFPVSGERPSFSRHNLIPCSVYHSKVVNVVLYVLSTFDISSAHRQNPARNDLDLRRYSLLQKKVGMFYSTPQRRYNHPISPHVCSHGMRY